MAANLRNVASTIDEVVLDGAGHFLTEERPDEVVQLLLGFFADEPPTDDRGRANPAEVGALACATLRSQPMAILNGAEF